MPWQSPRLGPEAGGEDLGVALAAKEEHPLVKDRQPLISAGREPPTKASAVMR